ncbi:MAG: hypothetical protein WCG97_01350 [bacterium]
MSKVRIGILRGGPSHEHEVSLLSGAHFLKNVQSDPEYSATDIFIDKRGVWHIAGAPKLPIDALQHFDVVVNNLHGNYGEDGEVQKLLELSGVPFVGNSVYPSVTAFNKGIFKRTLSDLGIKTPVYREMNVGITDDLNKIARELFGSFPLPAIIKPQTAGSSMGVSVATNYNSLVSALREAALVSNAILIEEYISGAEIVSGFVEGLRGQDTYILLPVSISSDEKRAHLAQSKLWNGHLDTISRHMGKYNIELPKGLSNEHKKEIEKIIKTVKEHLGMRHYATFDFIVSPKRGVYLIESDTSPHLGENSPLLASLKEGGVKVVDFFKHLIQNTLGFVTNRV